MKYSPLFNTLYDEQRSVGKLGTTGTHYSVLSAVQWLDKHKRPLLAPGIQKFAIIWDEDHDERVIDVIERAYMQELLGSVLYIGEKKAGLTVVVDEEFYSLNQDDLVSYTMAWQGICGNVHEDSWTFHLVTLDKSELGIIAAPYDKVATYMNNIHNLWDLGTNLYVHPTKLSTL